MSKFSNWCEITPVPVKKTHRLEFLTSKPKNFAIAVKAVSKVVPQNYIRKDRIVDILNSLGKQAAARALKEELPTTKKSRSGDLGEILATSYVTEMTEFCVPIKRLQWSDHREMPMRGEDIIAIKFNDSGPLEFLKAEVKSENRLSRSTISKAAKALLANDELPTPHGLAFVASRLYDLGEKELSHQIDMAHLSKQIKVSQVSHLLFTFSGNNPQDLLKEFINRFKGKTRQLAVGLRIHQHQTFIKTVYEKVLGDGPQC